jgi:hypothetical protein
MPELGGLKSAGGSNTNTPMDRLGKKDPLLLALEGTGSAKQSADAALVSRLITAAIVAPLKRLIN